MPVLTEGRHTAAFLLSEANGNFSRDRAVFATPNKVVSGQVVGAIAFAAAVAAAAAGNTGNGTCSAVVVTNKTKQGVYRVTFIEAEANLGAFEVEAPDGKKIGTGKVGVLFDKQIEFTISDGSTDFKAGDEFLITVAPGSGKYAPLNLAATNGAAVAAGIAYSNYDATDADVPGVIVARNAELKKDNLVWPAGISNDDKAAQIQILAAKGLIIR